MLQTIYFILLPIITLSLLYTARHYWFTLNRLFGVQRHPYIDIDTANWPSVTVLIAAHNEEAVVAEALTAVLESVYPFEKMTIMPVNDRSTDRTKEIIDQFVVDNPGRITPFHREGGKPGKAAALKQATDLVKSDIIVVFDADYLPSRGLIKQLVMPFFDPEIGVTMGRVVPYNVGSNLLTRLLDLERSGGYQVDQQARMNMRMIPQYGGTVGGIRMSALQSIGGWHDDVLAEDTDITFRLLMNHWKTVYQNRSECYEEVPESWSVRVRQIMRWAKGHNQVFYRQAWNLVRSKNVSPMEKADGIALLFVYSMGPIFLMGWFFIIILFYFNTLPFINSAIAVFMLMTFGALGNFATFFQIAAATYMDGSRKRIRLLPLNCFSFLVGIFSISKAMLDQVILDPLLKRELRWDKTVRYRKIEQAPR